MSFSLLHPVLSYVTVGLNYMVLTELDAETGKEHSKETSEDSLFPQLWEMATTGSRTVHSNIGGPDIQRRVVTTEHGFKVELEARVLGNKHQHVHVVIANPGNSVRLVAEIFSNPGADVYNDGGGSKAPPIKRVDQDRQYGFPPTFSISTPSIPLDATDQTIAQIESDHLKALSMGKAHALTEWLLKEMPQPKSRSASRSRAASRLR